MENDIKNYENVTPVIKDKTEVELKDYLCPFCNFKLFRGNVTEYNMVCSQCNKLVRSSMISNSENDPEL